MNLKRAKLIERDYSMVVARVWRQGEGKKGDWWEKQGDVGQGV